MFSRLSVLGGHEAFNITYEIYSIFCHCPFFNDSVLKGNSIAVFKRAKRREREKGIPDRKAMRTRLLNSCLGETMEKLQRLKNN